MVGVSLDDLIAEVRASAAGDDPLDRVDVAIRIAAELVDHADALVDYYVVQARSAGRSWTEIGARLGVSKQAARKRFTPAATTIASPVLAAGVTLRPRLRACLDQAAVHAQAQGAAEVGTDHLLAGLLHD